MLRNLLKSGFVLIIIALVAIVVTAGAPSGDFATTHSGTMVAVIVQKADDSGRAEARAEALGATITRDLHIINAFAAEMPAGAVAELAADRAVRLITPDRPVTGAGNNSKVTYYLMPASVGVDSVATAVLPVSEEKPPKGDLPNYDTDRDGALGRRSRPGPDPADV